MDAEIDDVPAAGPTRVGGRRALAYLGLCLVLIGLNLRTVFSSFSAVLPEVTSDAGLPGWAVVVLTTVPVTLLGVFAPLAPVLARRFGAERVLLGAMAVLPAGLLLRPAWTPRRRTPAGVVRRNGSVRCRDCAVQRIAARAGETGLPTPARPDGRSVHHGDLRIRRPGRRLHLPRFQRDRTVGFGAVVLGGAGRACCCFSFRWPYGRGTGSTKWCGTDPNVWRSAVAWQVTIFMVLQAMMSSAFSPGSRRSCASAGWTAGRPG